MNGKHKAIAIALVAGTAALAVAAWRSFTTVGSGNLGPGPVDALIVFGSPAEFNGAPSAMQTWRVGEAVAEYRRGVASHLILTGGAAGNRWVEANVMAGVARGMGVPDAAIVTDGHSLTSIQNLQNAVVLMQRHGWKTAEFISSEDHLPRIAVIARTAPFQWRLHPAPTPGRGRIRIVWADAEEAAATLVLRTFGSAAEPVVHAVALCEHALLFVPRWIVWKLRGSLAR